MITRRLLLGSGLAPLMRLHAATVPRPAPDFVIRTLGGRLLPLRQHRGHVVAVEFLYTTCPHCQRSARLLTSLHKRLGLRGFQPLGVAFNEMAAMLVPEFVTMTEAAFPIGVDTRESVCAFLSHDPGYRLAVPQMVLIDRQGRIRFQTPAEGDASLADEGVLEGKIEALLREPASVQKPSTAVR